MRPERVPWPYPREARTAMMSTLHSYVLRELLKTFALTLIALTALLTMGGGLYNVLRYEGAGAGDVLGFLPMLIPIMVALAMPVAAIFATAMVYGRFAADNEFTACRAAGVNVHRLFLGALLLSLFVAVFTLLFGDLVVPDVTRRLNQYVRTNLRDIALQRMETKGYVRYQRAGKNYLLTAENMRVPSERALQEQHLPTAEGFSYLLMDSPIFMMLDKDEHLLRYACAKHGLCQFDGRQSPLEVTLFVNGGRDFDLNASSAYLESQQIGPISVPLEFPRRPGMVDLATLMRWRDHPWEIEQLQPKVRAFQLNLAQSRFADDCAARVTQKQPIELANERGDVCRIQAAAADVKEKGLLLSNARVEQPQRDGGPPLYYDAPLVWLRPRTAAGEELFLQSAKRIDQALVIRVDLDRTAEQPLLEHNPRASDYRSGREKAPFALAADFRIPPHILARLQDYTEEVVFNPAAELPFNPELTAARQRLLTDAAAQQRKMSSNIQFRLGVACSALVTVLMAAALGAIFRGSQALAAFGLACIPFGAAALAIVMARSLGEKPDLEFLSPLITWAGLGLIGVLDVFILRVGVRR
jgi:lipopolysaccharide export LptBFGC system permease protein LptF